MKLLTTKEVADRLGVTQTRIQQLILERRLPAQKMGRDNFVKEEDLQLVADRKPGRPPKTKAEVPKTPKVLQAQKMSKKGMKK